MPDNSGLLGAASAAGRSAADIERRNQNTRAVMGAAGLAGDIAEIGWDIYSSAKRVEALEESRRKEDFSKLQKALDETFVGNKTYGTAGSLDRILEASSDYDNLEKDFQQALDLWMDADFLVSQYGVSKGNAEMFISENRGRYSDMFQQLAVGAREDAMIAKNVADYAGPEGDGTGGKFALYSKDIRMSTDEAIEAYRSEYRGSHPEIWDPDGQYSLENENNMALFLSNRAESEGRRIVEDLVGTTDLTFSEIVSKALDRYDSIVDGQGFADANARLLLMDSREALELSLREYATQQAGVLASEAEAKAVRFQNIQTDKYEAGIKPDDASFIDSYNEAGLTPGNIYDEAKIRDLKIAQYGYDKDLSGAYQRVDDILAADDFISEISRYAYMPDSSITVAEGGQVSLLDAQIDEALSMINSDQPGSVLLTSKYAGFIKEKADEYGLNQDEVEYLSRSVNQKAASLAQQDASYWEGYINELIANPEVTEAIYTAELTNLRNAGWISDLTFNSYIGKKSSPWAQQIDTARNMLKYELGVLYGDEVDERWTEMTARADFNDNIDRFITNMMSTKGAYDDKAVQNWVQDYIAVLKNDDITDLVYKNIDQILDTTYAMASGSWPMEDATLSELREMYFNSDFSLYFYEDAVGAGTLYLQGTSATRTGDGLYDAVAKALYGDNATYDDATEYQKEIIKANGGVALALYEQYSNSAKTFEDDGNKNMRDAMIRGAGRAAMDDEGYVYFEQEDGSFLVGYVTDDKLRKKLTQTGNTERVINMATDGISWQPYRLKKVSYPVQPESHRVNEYNGGHTEQVYGYDLSMSEQDDPAARAEWDSSNPRMQPPPEAYMPRELEYRPLNPWNDPEFIGLRYMLRNGRT